MTADRPTTQYSRRKFLGRVGQVSMALAVPAVIPGSALGLNGAIAPSNRITLGAIGIRGRGREDLRHFLNNRDVQFLAICDVPEGAAGVDQARWPTATMAIRTA